MEKYVSSYIKLRDLKEQLKKKHTNELAPINDAMDKLEAKLLEVFAQQGLQNIKTTAGTAYRAERTSISPADWDTFLEWVRQNDAWSCLERRVAKTAVEEILEQTGSLPPGLNRRSEFVVNVRR